MENDNKIKTTNNNEVDSTSAFYDIFSDVKGYYAYKETPYLYNWKPIRVDAYDFPENIFKYIYGKDEPFNKTYAYFILKALLEINRDIASIILLKFRDKLYSADIYKQRNKYDILTETNNVTDVLREGIKSIKEHVDSYEKEIISKIGINTLPDNQLPKQENNFSLFEKMLNEKNVKLTNGVFLSYKYLHKFNEIITNIEELENKKMSRLVCGIITYFLSHINDKDLNNKVSYKEDNIFINVSLYLLKNLILMSEENIKETLLLMKTEGLIDIRNIHKTNYYDVKKDSNGLEIPLLSFQISNYVSIILL